VLDAERWGDDVLQPIARRLIWPAFARSPRSMASYQRGSKLPAFPMPVLLALAPVITRVERKLNDAGDDGARADLRALPGHLDRVDAWLADGTLGGERPNRADLQIAPTVRLLMTLGDVAPLVDGRPAAEHARRVAGDWHGHVPAGTLPADWLPAAA
jgi:glutathione S-transferase